MAGKAKNKRLFDGTGSSMNYGGKQIQESLQNTASFPTRPDVASSNANRSYVKIDKSKLENGSYRSRAFDRRNKSLTSFKGLKNVKITPMIEMIERNRK